ncbi:MAG: type III secretion system chaperone [Prosthecobacter sp.]
MPAPAHLQHLLTQIGPQMELDEVTAYEEENFWLLQGGDDVLIEIAWDEDREMVVFSGLLGTVPEDNAASVHAMLLNYNYAWDATGGARMAVDPNDNEAVLLLDHPVADLDLPALQAILASLLEMVPAWRALLEQSGTEICADSPLDLSMPGIRI